MVYALYTADSGVQYAKLVDRENAADPIRGWSQADPTGFQGWPVGAKPRVVFGVSPTTGRRNSTIVASNAAALWVGTTTAFECETNSSAEPTDTYTVTRRRGESFPVPGLRPLPVARVVTG